VGRRAVEVALDQDVDAVVERRREQQALADLRRAVEQALHGRQEAEVGHVVGLVEHGDLDAGQVRVPLADEVLEPARAGDEDVDAGREGLDLRVLPDAAEDDGARQAGGLRQRLDDGEHLVGQLAGRHEDEPARLARTAPAAGQAGDEREAEGEGLAAARAPAPEHVPAGERVGERRELDRERVGDALTGERGGEGCGDAQTREGGVGG
jgi:hypothetical protein